MNTWRKLAVLGALYLAQGLPFGFFTGAIPAVIRQEGGSLGWVSASTLLALPWALKILMAPWVDRLGSDRWGRRKSWIVPLQVFAVLLLLSLAQLPEGDAVLALAVGMFLTSVASATQDVATDGLAVDWLSASERGLGNGVQVAGYRLGMILGGGGLLVAYDVWGWQTTLYLMAAILVVSVLPVLWVAEPKRPRQVSAMSAVARPGLLGWLVLLCGYKAFDAMASTMLRPLLVDRGWSLTDLGIVVGTLASVTGLLGALLGGYLAGRDRMKALVGCGLAQATAVLLFLPLSWEGVASSYGPVAIGVEAFAGGMATAALFTAMMDTSRPATGATDFTLQASVVVVASGLGGSVSGPLAEALGYGGLFGLSAVLTAVGVGLMGVFGPSVWAHLAEGRGA